MKKNILLSLVAIPFIIGCGGGDSIDSSVDTTVDTASLAKITGTVPGTLIEAFCDDGSYSQVSSTDNDTNEHPFEIEVPVNTNCKLIMTTNENDDLNRIITPIGFVNGDISGSTIVLNDDIDLGNIALELDYESANDVDGDHVVDAPYEVEVEIESINDDSVQDYDNDGSIDAYDDDDNDDIVNAYEDDDNDGTYNIYDDDDNDDTPDYLEDDDDDGEFNHTDDDDNDDTPDYVEDDDNDGESNHVDSDDDGDGIDDEYDDDDSSDSSDDDDSSDS